MDKSGTRRDWEGFGAAGMNNYPSGPPDFTKTTTTSATSDQYSSQTASTLGSQQTDFSQQPFDGQFEQKDVASGLMGHVANATETAKVAAVNALEGGKNLARQASEGAKNLASGAWEKISSFSGPKP